MNRITQSACRIGPALLFCLAMPHALRGGQEGPVSFSSTNEFGDSATIPVAWADFDNDGDLDLAVGNYFNQTNELYINQGDGTFTRQTPFGAGNTFAVAAADYDNDGDQDLAIGNNGQNYLYVNDGVGGFIQEIQFGGLRTVAVAWGDADQDGDLDLAVGNGILGAAQQNYLYINNGDGTFTGEEQFGLEQTDSIVWGDCDNDGDLDIACGNGGFFGVGQNKLYINNGDGTYIGSDEFGVEDTASVAWADANGDGWLDLAVANWDGGQSYLYLNDGDGTFTQQLAFGTHDTNTITWGDVDHDGDLDAALGNGDFGSAEQNSLYLNDGSGVFTETDLFGVGSTDGVAWADIDDDGDLDLAVGNEHTPEQNELWTNLLDDTAYLQLDLVGQFHDAGTGFSNRDAIGARVSLYTEGHIGDSAFLIGMQDVEAHGGFSSQNARTLTFGTAGDAAVDVRIRWPGSGGESITQDLLSVATGQRLTVTESAPPGEIVLTDVAVVFGSLLSGDIGALSDSDDVYLHTRSARGFLAFEPNLMEVVLGAEVQAEAPTSLDVLIEARINHPVGIAKLRIRNWVSNAFEEVNVYGIGPADDAVTTFGIDTADRVREADGRIEISIKHVVITVFSAAGFDSFIDHVGVTPTP